MDGRQLCYGNCHYVNDARRAMHLLNAFSHKLVVLNCHEAEMILEVTITHFKY